ncbi:MAG: methyltransferase domain-containing protein [Bacteroidota bacterium]
MEENQYFQTNRELWDEKTMHHKNSTFYNLEGFKKGESSLQEIELQALANEVSGKSLLHLQCHFGQDTISWARMGAKVTGMDLSPKAIQLAQSLNDELNLDAQFISCNIYDLPQHLDQQFDIVFTSYGVLTWLPDLDQWASIIARYLRPGGRFYIAEFHPVMYMYDFDQHKIAYRYFSHREPYTEVELGTYADPDAAIEMKEYFWCHSLSETIQALLKQGLVLTEFLEFPWSPYNCFPNMQAVAPRRYVYGNLENRLPHVFSLKMTKPEQ